MHSPYFTYDDYWIAIAFLIGAAIVVTVIGMAVQDISAFVKRKFGRK